MKILALDLGKFKTVGCQYDTHTGDVSYTKVKMAPFIIHQLFTGRRPDRIVFEIGPAAGWVHDIAEGFGVEIQVANPNGEGWRWRNTKRKTDRMDALKLAKLSAADQLPTVYVPSRPVRQRRSLIAYRHALVARRTRVKNRIRSILHGEGLPVPVGAKGWTQTSLQRLREWACPMEEATAAELWPGELYEELESLEQAESRLLRVEKTLGVLNRSDKRVQQLQTIPGVGPRTAEALVATIDNPHRFQCGKQVGSYVGLVPRLFESGKTSHDGRITCQGNKILRTLLVEASWVALRYNPWLRRVYERVKGGSRKRSKIAIVAVARRLLVTAWAMLRDETPWRMPTSIAQT